MTQPSLLLAGFIGLVALLWRLGHHPRWSRLFRFLPVPFWCYFLPMLATTLGWIPAESSLYPFLSRQLLPVCLVLLLIGTDLRSLARLGPGAIVLMLIGAGGTMLGGLIRSHPQTVYTELTQLFYHGLQLPGKGMETWPGEK